MKRILCLIAVFAALSARTQAPALFPQPASMTQGKGSFVLRSGMTIVATDEADKRIAGLLNDYLQKQYGFRLPVAAAGSGAHVRIGTRRFIRPPEKDAYTLSVGAGGVRLEGDTYAGTFHGLQTLLQ